MFSHVMLGSKDLQESIRFYDKVMPVLGYSRQSTGDTFAGYGSASDIATGKNCLWIGRPLNGLDASAGNGVNIALNAKNREQVDRFYDAAISAGAVDEGAPGIREEAHPNFYAAYVRDPTGNKLVVVCHDSTNLL